MDRLLNNFCAAVWSATEESQGGVLSSSALWTAELAVPVAFDCLSTSNTDCSFPADLPVANSCALLTSYLFVGSSFS